MIYVTDIVATCKNWWKVLSHYNRSHQTADQ